MSSSQKEKERELRDLLLSKARAREQSNRGDDGASRKRSRSRSAGGDTDDGGGGSTPESDGNSSRRQRSLQDLKKTESALSADVKQLSRALGGNASARNAIGKAQGAGSATSEQVRGKKDRWASDSESDGEGAKRKHRASAGAPAKPVVAEESSTQARGGKKDSDSDGPKKSRWASDSDSDDDGAKRGHRASPAAPARKAVADGSAAVSAKPRAASGAQKQAAPAEVYNSLIQGCRNVNRSGNKCACPVSCETVTHRCGYRAPRFPQVRKAEPHWRRHVWGCVSGTRQRQWERKSST
jgi:hypothetical protein